MNYATLAVGLAFAVLAVVFSTRAGRASDPTAAKNAKLASTLMIVASAGFLAAGAISLLGVS